LGTGQSAGTKTDLLEVANQLAGAKPGLGHRKGRLVLATVED
jgi:hypothetical protein